MAQREKHLEKKKKNLFQESKSIILQKNQLTKHIKGLKPKSYTLTHSHYQADVRLSKRGSNRFLTRLRYSRAEVRLHSMATRRWKMKTVWVC